MKILPCSFTSPIILIIVKKESFQPRFVKQTNKKKTQTNSLTTSKLGGSAVGTLEGKDAIHLDRIKEWSYGNLMKFNKANCKVLQLGQDNPNIKTD